MGVNEIESLRNENQLLRLRIAALEEKIESIQRNLNRPNRYEENGLADGRYFSRRLREAILAAQRYARFVSVIRVEMSPTGSFGHEADKAIETASHLRKALRQTDLVAVADDGTVYLLLEESEAYQAVQALKRIQDDMADMPPANYSVASFPHDANDERTLLNVLEERSNQLRRINTSRPAVHVGEEVLSLKN